MVGADNHPFTQGRSLFSPFAFLARWIIQAEWFGSESTFKSNNKSGKHLYNSVQLIFILRPISFKANQINQGGENRRKVSGYLAQQMYDNYTASSNHSRNSKIKVES